MVRAILGGTKTQTRRVVRLRNGQYIPPSERKDPNGWAQLLRLCPYGQPGDLLWIREAFDPIYGQSPRDRLIEVDYRASWEPHGKHWRVEDEMGLRRWKPSIHMRRELSRILLEITGVRVERLQDISEADALAEGVSPDMGICWKSGDDTPRGMYGELWESINGPRSWESNPWVWVVAFKRVTP